MDHFGIGTAIEAVAEVYIRSGRGSGRTTQLLHDLKDGDRVICPTQAQANLLQRQCKERGLDVQCISVDPKDPGRLMELGTSQERTIFEHTWVEEFYRRAIKQAEVDIDYFQKRLSGWQEAHEKTRLQYQEAAKWQY